MLPRRALPLTLASLLAGLAGTARAATPVWVSGEVPPYLWLGAKGPEGYAFELFERVLRQAEISAELRFYPWARALRMLQSRDAHAALVIARAPERDAEFRWLFPIGSFRFALVTRGADGPVSGDIAALRTRRVGCLRGSVTRGMLEAAGVTRLVEGKDHADLMALLQRGIVDAIIGAEAVMRSLDTRPAGAEGLLVTPLGQSRELYAAAGTAMPEAAVQRVRAAYQLLVDNGSVAVLRRRHPGLFPDE